MATRCVINFCDGDEVAAKIYRHDDGYPDGQNGVPADLEKFFKDVEEQCDGDNRFDDPTCLSARYVVWQAKKKAREYDSEKREYVPTPPLRFLGVRVVVENPFDIEYEYFVDCSSRSKRPVVKHKKREIR